MKKNCKQRSKDRDGREKILTHKNKINIDLSIQDSWT